jgi:hypothetical protein
MPCNAYKRLESELKSVSTQYAQFTYRENTGIRGTSKTESARIRSEAKSRKRLLIDQMIGHQQNCEACKANRVVTRH